MPNGHIRQYEELVAEAQKRRLQITRQQKRQIARLFKDAADELHERINRPNTPPLDIAFCRQYGAKLQAESRHIYQEVEGIVGNGIREIARSQVYVQQQFFGSVLTRNGEIQAKIGQAMYRIPEDVTNELMNGGIYKDFTGLSERIWDYKRAYDHDIQYIIERGIIEQKSALDISRDLELYLQPGARKPWEWKKVYPRSREIVDYNAQRLARTSCTHAYQMSFQRATRDNPFITKYRWETSGGSRVCEICQEREGKLFDKDNVPLDHPNGMCILTAVIEKSYDEIADELREWANGGENEAIDRWLGQ